MNYKLCALIFLGVSCPIQANAGERSTVVVGGPYAADIVGAASLPHKFGMMIMKPMFNADVSMLTSTGTRHHSF